MGLSPIGPRPQPNARPAPKPDEGKAPATEVRLGPLPGRDTYVPSPQRPVTQQPAPAGQNATFVPLGPGFATVSVIPAPPVPETTAREDRPLTVSAGYGGIEGKHVGAHYNLSDKTAIGGTVGQIDGGVTSYTLDMRQYVASERNWGIYVQPGIHALSGPGGTGAAGSAQLGLEWRTHSGITFNVFGGGVYTPRADRQFGPTAGVSIGLSF